MALAALAVLAGHVMSRCGRFKADSGSTCELSGLPTLYAKEADFPN